MCDVGVSVWIILVLAMIGASAVQWHISRNSFTTMAYTSGGSYSEGVLGPLENLNPIFAKTNAEKFRREIAIFKFVQI